MSTQVPQGWHHDPERPGWLRYWTGSAWTEQWRPTDTTASVDNAGLVNAGWVCAVFVPIAGFVIGIILAARNDPQGGWIILMSLVLSALYFYAFGIVVH